MHFASHNVPSVRDAYTPLIPVGKETACVCRPDHPSASPARPSRGPERQHGTQLERGGEGREQNRPRESLGASRFLAMCKPRARRQRGREKRRGRPSNEGEPACAHDAHRREGRGGKRADGWKKPGLAAARAEKTYPSTTTTLGWHYAEYLPTLDEVLLCADKASRPSLAHGHSYLAGPILALVWRPSARRVLPWMVVLRLLGWA